MNLHSIRFSYVFVSFFTFLLFLDKVCAFHPHFYLSISALTRQSHTGQKFSEKFFFCKGALLYFKISLLSFIHKIWNKIFIYIQGVHKVRVHFALKVHLKCTRTLWTPCITVYLVRIWTYKNADKKAHAFSRRSKNVKKRIKTYEKRILCKFTFILKMRIIVALQDLKISFYNKILVSPHFVCYGDDTEFAIAFLNREKFCKIMLFVMSQNCEMQGCQWHEVKRIKTYFCE